MRTWVIFAWLVGLAIAASGSGAAMHVTTYQSACGPAMGVMAENVTKDDDPIPALRAQAQHACPMGYDKLDESSQLNGTVVIWSLKCHTQEANNENTAPSTCGRRR